MRTDLVRRLERLTSRRLQDPLAALSLWEAVAADPSTRVEARLLAPALVRRLRSEAGEIPGPPVQSTGLRFQARGVAARALAAATEPRLRATLDLERLLAHLDLGELPKRNELDEVARAALGAADSRLETGDTTGAAVLLISTMGALLHRNLHCEDIPSALAADPDRFLAPLRASASYRLLATPTRTNDRPGGASFRAAQRILAVSHGNFHFLEPILDHLRDHNGVEIQRLDTTAPPAGLSRPRLTGLVAERLARATGEPPQASLAPAPGSPVQGMLDWADTVVVDWCNEAAVWASMHVPDSVRLVVRLHSVEALSMHPHVVDYGGVAHLVFVSDQLRALVRAELPQTGSVATSVLANAMPLAPFQAPKRPGAERTLALVGWAVTVKDPIWALEVLALLRRDDPAWRLLLVGNDFADSIVARGWRYRADFQQRRRRSDVRDAVVELGHRNDLTEVLRDVGVILSTSRRESFHVGLLQGASSGALPVVRDWPLVAPWGGARAIVPDDWVVRTPAEAAARIRQHADAPGGLSRAGDRARIWTTEHYDWPRVAPAYEALLLGR